MIPSAAKPSTTPSIYPDAQELDGIGDNAFLPGGGNCYDMAFLDGSTAGFFSYTDGDLGPSGPAPGIPEERAIELLTIFHDRVG